MTNLFSHNTIDQVVTSIYSHDTSDQYEFSLTHDAIISVEARISITRKEKCLMPHVGNADLYLPAYSYSLIGVYIADL